MSDEASRISSHLLADPKCYRQLAVGKCNEAPSLDDAQAKLVFGSFVPFEECKKACDDHLSCISFVACKGEGGYACYLKGEQDTSSVTRPDCRTHHEIPCSQCDNKDAMCWGAVETKMTYKLRCAGDLCLDEGREDLHCPCQLGVPRLDARRQ